MPYSQKPHLRKKSAGIRPGTLVGVATAQSDKLVAQTGAPVRAGHLREDARHYRRADVPEGLADGQVLQHCHRLSLGVLGENSRPCF